MGVKILWRCFLSLHNGDKSRSQRQRKKKVAQRLRNRKLREGLAAPSKAGQKAAKARPAT